ncbi:rhodanese-like domain-containing protein [Bacillaceae bacterium SIJ1]|uniref:rhodanese-like domain-containing protein n=1 Tax=Litoribacterium kuwaitense TaxID=1398745 RepID=UPI0013EBA31D|nr:rhodanese-like domain-containing protein [Litoribacterium kuwaitense]NGP46762.1 rhodanese-like domain-containing protein [Litoribacterium kuwaitense]
MNALDYFNARLQATISPMDYLIANKNNPEAYVLIDVSNGPAHVRHTTIKEAIVIPEKELQSRIDEIPKDKEVIVYCWDVWCNTAAKSAKYLLEKGYTVKELTGGIAAWQEMNFPISKTIQEDDTENHCGC